MFVLAHYWSGGGPGPWILFVPVFWVLVILCLVVLLVILARRAAWRHGGPGRPFGGPWHGADANSPIAELGRRFAAGEIDEEEYRRRLAVLEERFGAGPAGPPGPAGPVWPGKGGGKA
ncbi:SHOCT domain-containing protein [Streptomyces celluloflavus]|uniref:SHOCT domain-containing protein n=1 Tax=Streptomyces celluloflavus TaxID=58344 RepID=A0ABW7R8Y7_9ACTN|nr:SHOCT domain-containing protein [Streptomyces kasugaensis]WSK11151.1 SHOCT domain-containing protein [Streptomyces celluloflavus]